MNWREVNVKGGFVAGWITWGLIAFVLTSGFFAAAMDLWLGPNAPGTPGVRIPLLLVLDAAVLIPLGVYLYRRYIKLGAMTAAERAVYQAARDQYWAAVWRNGWVRYASAAVMIWGAVWLLQSNKDGKDAWLAIGLLIYALIRAREISLLLLGVGALWLLFHGVAALPVSVAIIIGAIIIASAMRR
jgi:hypothetical protein